MKGLISALPKRAFKLAKAVSQRVSAWGANFGISIYCKRKIAGILKGLPEQKDFSFGKKFLNSYNDTRWHRAYAAANGIVSDDYVPEDLFYTNIEAALNAPRRAAFYLDKNNMDKLRLSCVFPYTLGRIVCGRFLSADYQEADPASLAAYPSVVVKPSLDSGGGRDVVFLSGTEAADFAKRHPDEECIFQEPIKQCAELAALAPDSVNTIRIMTMLEEGGVRELVSVLRFGRRGSRVDNQAAGGISCGIKNGRLIAKAYDKNFHSYDRHPDTGVVFEGYEVPAFEKALRLCFDLHAKIPEIGLISWDIAIDEKHQPVVIELNMINQEINFLQLANGPLFGDRLAEILAKTKPFVLLNIPLA